MDTVKIVSSSLAHSTDCNNYIRLEPSIQDSGRPTFVLFKWLASWKVIAILSLPFELFCSTNLILFVVCLLSYLHNHSSMSILCFKR